MARPRSISGINFPATHVVVDPTPEQIRQDLMLLEHKMGDYNLPLQRSKQIIIGSVAGAFVKEKDPLGTKWPRLSPSAERVPRMGMLRRRKTNAKLFRDMTNRYNYGVSKEGVYLNTSRVVHYMPYHQQDDKEGGTDIVKIDRGKFNAAVNQRIVQLFQTRRYEGYGKVERLKLLQQDAREEVARDMRKRAGTGATFIGATGLSRIPQRRFLGIDKPSQDQIRDTMDLWAKDVIIIYKRGKNIIQAPKRGLK